MRKDETPRALGPYPHRNKWRVVYKGCAAGQSRRETEIFDNRKDAEDARDAFNDEAQGKTKLTLEKTFELYIQHHKDKGNKVTTQQTVMDRLKAFFPERDRLLRSITPAYCDTRYRELTQTNAVDTHRNTLKEVSRFFRWCIKKKHWDRNPAQKVEPMGRRSRGKPQLRIDGARVLFQWVETILAILETPNPIPALGALEIRPPGWYHGEKHLLRYKRIVACGVTATLTALVLGLRVSEITKRKVSDLDDQGRILHIEDAKTLAGERVLVVPELLRPYLLNLAKGLAPDDFLFGDKNRRMVWNWTKRLCELAGVPRVSPHGLRGSFASIATAQGQAIQAVASALGHASTSVTEAHYTKPEAKVEANAARLAESLRPSQNDTNIVPPPFPR